MTVFRLPACKNCCPAFFEVYVTEDVASLRAVVKDVVFYENDKMLGACVGIEGALPNGLLGYIFLAQNYLGSGYVAHELAHATFRSCEFHKVRVRHSARRESAVHDSEEIFCQLLEVMNAGFWNEAYRLGLAIEGEKSATTERPAPSGAPGRQDVPGGD